MLLLIIHLGILGGKTPLALTESVDGEQYSQRVQEGCTHFANSDH